MTSRLEEDERNERTTRNLIKLSENRRCINCNSLGPQYVCINFWIFICTTCSGVHREFTHRIKSVSMAKFTSQEVSALQGRGNARAKEIYFKEWDPQSQSFPDSSNIERLRDFIKHVYVDRRYAGEKSFDKPPRLNMRHLDNKGVLGSHVWSFAFHMSVFHGELLICIKCILKENIVKVSFNGTFSRYFTRHGTSTRHKQYGKPWYVFTTMDASPIISSNTTNHTMYLKSWYSFITMDVNANIYPLSHGSTMPSGSFVGQSAPNMPPPLRPQAGGYGFDYTSFGSLNISQQRTGSSFSSAGGNPFG